MFFKWLHKFFGNPTGFNLYGYIPFLDGARGIAILWVVFHHTKPILNVPILSVIQSTGELGVELFFAISGILVTRSLEQCRARFALDARAPAAREFMLRRISRIWPPYFLYFFLAVLLALVMPSVRSAVLDYGWRMICFPLFLANYFIPFWESPDRMFTVTWSLAYEEQFYLFLVGCFLVIGQKYYKLVLAAGILSFLMRVTIFSFPDVSIWKGQVTYHGLHMFLHLRLDAIALPSFAWHYRDHIKKIWQQSIWTDACANLVVFVSLIYCVQTFKQVPTLTDPADLKTVAISFSYFGPLFTLFLLSMGYSRLNPFKMILQQKGLVFVGVICFEIYLLHFPAIYLVESLTRSLPLANIGGVVASVLAGMLFYKFWGKPSQAWLRARWIQQ